MKKRIFNFRRFMLVFVPIVVVSLVALYVWTNSWPEQMAIFEDIASLDSLEVVEALPSGADDNLQSLSYLDYRGGKYIVDNVVFTLFAYEFEDAESAKQYFTNFSRKTEPMDSDYYVCSPGNLVVVRGCFAYSLYAHDMNSAFDAISTMDDIMTVSVP